MSDRGARVGLLFQDVASEDPGNKFPWLFAVHYSLKNQEVCTLNFPYSLNILYKMEIFFKPVNNIASFVSTNSEIFCAIFYLFFFSLFRVIAAVWISQNLLEYILISLLTVSSFQMALTCVKNMTAVKMAKSKLSKIRNRSSTTVAGGEKEEHSRHSLLTQIMNW